MAFSLKAVADGDAESAQRFASRASHWLARALAFEPADVEHNSSEQ
jgi:hypothetical protein